MSDLAFDPTYTTVSREKANIELALDPTANPLAYVKVPTKNQLDGFRRDPQVNRTDLFIDAGSETAQAVSVKHNLGAQNFQVVGNPKNETIQAMITKGGPSGTNRNAVMVRYTDSYGMSHQGQGILLFKGEAGSAPADQTIYEFTVEWTRAGEPTFPT